MLFTYFTLYFKKIKLKKSHELKIVSASKRFVSVQSLVVPKPSNYRFYDSGEYQPKPLKTIVNTWKPVFRNRINSFGDLPEVLIKKSKWFCYWQPLFKYWKKKKFDFKSRDLANLKVWGKGIIDFTLYRQLPLGISYSAFWLGFLTLSVNRDYRWLTIIAKDETELSNLVLKKMFNTTNFYILTCKSEYYPGFYEFTFVVRSNEFKVNELFFYYGFQCRLTDFLLLRDNIRVFRDSKKKWVWFKDEVEDFIYYIHTENKRRVFYQHIGGVIKKIGKTKFDFLKQSLPVKQKKNSVFENV